MLRYFFVALLMGMASTQVSGVRYGQYPRILGPTFAIPTNEPTYQRPPGDAELTGDAELVEMVAPMHLRGKDMTYHLIYPDGRDEIVLKYDGDVPVAVKI